MELQSTETSVSDSISDLVVKARECWPLDMDSWLDYAMTKSYEDVKAAIDEVRRTLPKEPSIWIAAAKLEEAKGKDTEWVERIVTRSVWVVKREGGVIARENWIKMAKIAERAGYTTTSRAMFANLYRIGVKQEEEDDLMSRRTASDVASRRLGFICSFLGLVVGLPLLAIFVKLA